MCFSVNYKDMKKHTRYFKLIPMNCSRFVETYNIGDVDDIWPGRRFVSRGQPYDWCAYYDESGRRFPRVSIHSMIPVIHFCDDVIDLLMWYLVSFKSSLPYNEVRFFEVKPLSKVYKQQCNDKAGLWQCGAHTIEIVQEMDFGDILRLANRNIDNRIPELINRYPEHNVLKLVQYIKNNVYEK